MMGYPLQFEGIVPRMRVVGLVDARLGVVTDVGDHSFHVKYDDMDSALPYPESDAHLFTAILAPGNPRLLGAPIH
jgi:hypothetical protein